MAHPPSAAPPLPGLAPRRLASRRLAPSVLAASLWLLPGAGLAFAVRDVANPRQSHGGWVADSAGILSPETETRINGMVDALEQQDGSELMVVTVPDTTGSSSPKTFATELFNTFRIGKKGVDNGVLMLIAKGDRRVEIETGYGMEERLPDARVGAIISTAMLPRFRQGDFDGGTLAGVEEVIGTLSPETRKHAAAARKRNDVSAEWLRLWIFLIALYGLAILLVVHELVQARGFSKGEFSSTISGDSASSSGPAFFGRGGRSNASGGSSGGGSSGGGGAGGSW